MIHPGTLVRLGGGYWEGFGEVIAIVREILPDKKPFVVFTHGVDILESTVWTPLRLGRRVLKGTDTITPLPLEEAIIWLLAR